MQHNWRNKNTNQINKRKTYLDNCPDWDIINVGKTRIGVTNLQNGSLCSLISINKKRIVVTNTCGFDSIVCIIAGACINEFYKDVVETSNSNIMGFIRCFLKNGCSHNTYKLRAEILMNINQFSSQIDKNIITIDCLSNIGNIAQYVFQSDPSYIQTKSCNVCSKIIVRQSVIIPINIDIIKKYGFSELSKAILEGMPNNNSICCDQLMSENKRYGTQIFIECDTIEYGIERDYSLKEFVPKLQIDNNSFRLVGVIARYGGTGSGHYVPRLLLPRITMGRIR